MATALSWPYRAEQGRSARPVVPLTLDGCGRDDHLVDLLQDAGHIAPDDDGRCEVALEGYGYRWLRLMPRNSRRLA